ncbi:MAG: hypothetical protein Fur0025_00280 [Oscillatoriaceae cyanobacterium]
MQKLQPYPKPCQGLKFFPDNMFLEELKPLLEEVAQSPIAFLGGFVSGVFRLKLSDDPIKTWLEGQGAVTTSTDSPSGNGSNGSRSSGPQSISID